MSIHNHHFALLTCDCCADELNGCTAEIVGTGRTQHQATQAARDEAARRGWDILAGMTAYAPAHAVFNWTTYRWERVATPPAALRLLRLSWALCNAPNLTPQGADLMVRLDAAALALTP
jgi:hypothetical protein